MSYATILVNLEAGRTNAHLLQVARDVADRFQAGVIGTTTCAPIQMLYADCYVDGEIFQQDGKEIEKEIAEVKAEFHAAMEGRVKVLGWRSAVLVTPLADHIASSARVADLILTSAATNDPFNAARQVVIGDLVMQAGRPVLVVAPAPARFGMDRVVIGWRDTREARRAIADALPMLKAASKVSLIEIAAKEDLEVARSCLGEVVAWLARHGVTADSDVRPSTGDDAAGLFAMVEERGADIVVAGAYGHSRLREWALGGVTRSLIHQAGRSSFISH